MALTQTELPATHEIISQLIGQAILDLHRHGKNIHQLQIVNYLMAQQEKEADETRRFFLGVAAGLLAL